jgi:hypothetical protein
MKRRTQAARQKHTRKASTKPKGKSKYARKRVYCFAKGLWGFEVPNPKPWK